VPQRSSRTLGYTAAVFGVVEAHVVAQHVEQGGGGRGLMHWRRQAQGPTHITAGKTIFMRFSHLDHINKVWEAIENIAHVVCRRAGVFNPPDNCATILPVGEVDERFKSYAWKAYEG
jgi:hypothetical protein